MTVMEDYQINNVPGYGTLKAGVLETRKAALDAALADAAKIEFVRVKNSWGASRPDRMFVVPGYHDLYSAYLNGDVQTCEQDADGNTIPDQCYPDKPLNDMVLPPGY